VGIFPLQTTFGNLHAPVFSFPYNTIGNLFTSQVGRDVVYEWIRRLRHFCHALIHRQYLCQNFIPANLLLNGSILRSVNDITWRLNSVRSLCRRSLSGTKTFFLVLSSHCLHSCLLARHKMTPNSNVSHRFSSLGQHSFRPFIRKSDSDMV